MKKGENFLTEIISARLGLMSQNLNLIGQMLEDLEA